MARKQNRLTARFVQTVKKTGMYADGDGLYLQVTSATAKSWVLRFSQNRREHFMGLGSAVDVTLADARDRALAARRQARDGHNPIEARKEARAQRALDAVKPMTFKACAKAYVAAHETGWRNLKHAAQWTSTLEAYAYPEIGDLPVAKIDTGHVMKVVEPLWTGKTETASRVRGRIEAVLDWATVRKYRAGDNPARWRGHLAKLLPVRTKVVRVRHHPALAYQEVGSFVQQVRALDGIAPRALEFVILTVTRTGETIGARWDEIDLGAKTWTVPAERMKGGREHRVPLSARAIEVLEDLPREGDFVFPGGRHKAPLSNMALLAVLKRMKRTDITVHGFRSTFRDWGAEQTAYPRELLEKALAHAVGDAVEQAYQRGDLFEKRRRLMDEWARFCGTVAPSAAVVPIRPGGPRAG